MRDLLIWSAVQFSARSDNSWYPVYKGPWYPADILDILLLDLVETYGFFSDFSCFLLWPLSSDNMANI